MSQEKQERYHDVNKLNKYFAISSLLLLVVVAITFYDDYTTEWKVYQRQFRKWEVLKTREQTYQAEEVLGSEEYAKAYEAVEQAKAKVDSKKKELKAAISKLEGLEAKLYADNQLYQFAKAEYDTAKFMYEEAVGKGHGDEEKRKAILDKLSSEMEELSRKAQGTETELKEQQREVAQFTAKVAELEKTRGKILQDYTLLQRRLAKIDPYEMDTMNWLGNRFRDMPVVDFLNPYYKVNQYVLPDIRDELNFARSPRVDRCTTCHLGMTQEDFASEEEYEHPFRAHPNLDLFLTSRSPHPVESFGCTSCHEGRSRGTSFTSSAHTPKDREQHHEWEKKYHWHEVHHWEYPMYSTKYTEAGCFKCHSQESEIPGADKLNKGLMLIERAGCYGCHKIEKYEGKLKRGPSLLKLKSKVSEDWAFRWINDPKSFRHDTWMPKYFDQYNNRDRDSRNRSDQEIHAIVSYLFQKSDGFEMVDIPVEGDRQRGNELVSSLGCMGCHKVNPEKSTQTRTLDSMRREQGPNLAGIGSKASAKWIYNWIKDPKKYYPDTRMPDMRLTDQEAADIAAYLVTLKNEEFMKSDVPATSQDLLGEIAFDFLAKNNTNTEAQEIVKKKRDDGELSHFVGEKLIGHYGCFGCHDISGFETAKPIGTELTEESSKPLHRFDFGYVEIEHSHSAWYTKKLENPRIFDKARVVSPLDKLIMPNFQLSDDEVEAITTALLGFVKKDPYIGMVKSRTPRNLFIEEGQRIIREYNCQGCHTIENRGGVVRDTIGDWLANFQDKNRSDAISYSPPNLIGEGKKVHPQWLFQFIHKPTPIRPWLQVRMPTYGFSDKQINSLVKYFSYLDKADFPFVQKEIEIDEKSIELGEILFNELQCGRCHIAGDKMPGGSPENWAPNFALAKDRLKPNWIVKWLKDPLALLPGTKMPKFPYGEAVASGIEDEKVKGTSGEQQMNALRDFLIGHGWQSTDD